MLVGKANMFAPKQLRFDADSFDVKYFDFYFHLTFEIKNKIY